MAESFAFLGKGTWTIKDILIKKLNTNQENIWKTHTWERTVTQNIY